MNVDKRLAKLVALECYNKLGEDIQLLDVRRKCDYCNHVLIVSGKNRMHLGAMHDHIKEFLAERDVSCYGIDGKAASGWVIIDLGPLIIHLFLAEMREFYDLTGLWNSPKKVELEFPEQGEE